ncbi:MAG: hypothetical protein PQJ50_08790 [Spirochaetales bacterium]|nr:hypothetical protein [Spirochaetales bacterium]
MADRDKVLKDIRALLKGLETGDLQFLLNQAEVLDYNRKVRLEREEQKKETESSSESKKNSGKKAKSKKSAPPVDEIAIEQTERSKFFNLRIGTALLFMDYHEIQAIFKIARAAGNQTEGAARLYRWFDRERRDVLAEGGIGGPASPKLKIIYNVLLDTFTSG